MIAVFSKGILKIPHLELFVGQVVKLARNSGGLADCQVIAGWGMRPTSKRARRKAVEHKLPYLALEDGFIRSVGLGSQDPPLSIVVDDVGVYYDASRSSRIEQLVLQRLSAENVERARALVSAWRSGRVSKYNHLREYQGELPERYVLVVDQTFGDASVQYGFADANCFRRMIDAAVSENPGCVVLVKTHPDVFAGRKKGYFTAAELSSMSNVKILAEDVHPVRLVEHAEVIYVVTSQMGFEGLLWGKPVRVFGMPFYAGWGLTVDDQPAPARRKTVTLESLVYAALIDYPRYIDPETRQCSEPERLIEWMSLQRRMRERFDAKLCAIDFSYWKRKFVLSFLQGSRIRFAPDALLKEGEAGLVIWGMKSFNCSQWDNTQIIRIEDGFLRSVGLGTDLASPVSWAIDKRGIYYDSTKPSDLEHFFQTGIFDKLLLDRANALRQRLVACSVTKYNVGSGSWQRPVGVERVILVPGQVESDASIRYGAPGVNTNLGLLQAVRAANSSAYVVYKPHPDVVAGLRRQGKGEAGADSCCNEVVTDISMGDLLPLVDEVHTMTSLTGFEALLRGRKVVCYGQPFYAGWGLTTDIIPPARRTRRLSLDELVAGALFLYPTYVSRKTGRFTTPEQALDELLEWREQSPAGLTLWTRIKRVMLRYLTGVR